MSAPADERSAIAAAASTAAPQSRRDVLGKLAALPLSPSLVGTTPMSDTSSRPAASGPFVVFDVNETLLDFTVLAPVFVDIFGDAAMLREWFNQTILYSEALTLAGDYASSGSVGLAVLEMLAAIKGRTIRPPQLAELKRRSATLPTYGDTPAALARLRAAGFRLVTLNNNPRAAVVEQLSAAGLRPFFEQMHSIDDAVHRYKPARESYLALATTLAVPPEDLWLVSCHAFDTLGAAAVGYRTALILRPENAPVALGRPPTIVAATMGEIADGIVAAARP